VTPFGQPPAELSNAIKRSSFPIGQWVNAASISYLESQWDPRNETNNLSLGPCGTRYRLPSGIWAQTEDSVGYFQINICAWHGTSAYWYDADHNVGKAYDIWLQDGGWSRDWKISTQKLGLK
jgi:hypothetical protein